MMLVRKRGGEEVYAMKVLKKEALVRRNQVYTISYVYCMHACIKCSRRRRTNQVCYTY